MFPDHPQVSYPSPELPEHPSIPILPAEIIQVFVSFALTRYQTSGTQGPWLPPRGIPSSSSHSWQAVVWHWRIYNWIWTSRKDKGLWQEIGRVWNAIRLLPAVWMLRQCTFQGPKQHSYLLHPGNTLVVGIWSDVQYANTQGLVLGSSSDDALFHRQQRDLSLVISMHTAVRSLAKFYLAGGSAFSTCGRLENFHTKKEKQTKKRVEKVVIVQNGKPEIEGREARAANITERGLNTNQRPKFPGSPATSRCSMGKSAPALRILPCEQRYQCLPRRGGRWVGVKAWAHCQAVFKDRHYFQLQRQKTESS